MSQNPYQPPSADLTKDVDQKQQYAGFWIRVGASIIDSILLVFITMPLLWMVYGKAYFEAGGAVSGIADILISWVFPAVAVILFWIYQSATPGKMVVKIKIVDARSGGQPSKGRFIGRYMAYYVSAIPLGLGLLWVAFDKRKQGWHDKLAGTVVVRS
jgi:uncharacterized RDD family membrane protein YckC